jgi:lysophospholipase L1-like esterase
MALKLNNTSNVRPEARPWDKTWKEARAACSETPKNILIMGDSISQGASSTDYLTDGWVPKFKAKAVAAGLPVHGDYWPTCFSASFAAGLGSMSTPMPWVFAGNTAVWAATFGYGVTPLISTTPGGTITLTTPYACTKIDLITFEVTAGTYDISIDGGATQQITTTVLAFQRRISFTGLANTTHTLVISNQSAANVMTPLGAITYADTTKGICFSRQTFSGSNFQQHYGPMGMVWFPDDRLKMWQGNLTNGGNNVGFGFPTQPALAIVALTVNDCQLATGLGAYANYLKRLCQALRRGYADCSILFVVMSNPDGVSSDVTPNLSLPTNYPLYVNAVYNAASLFNCKVLNIHAEWADQGFALGYHAASDSHPNNAGHTNIADRVAAVLGLS